MAKIIRVVAILFSALLLSSCGEKDYTPRAIQPEVDTCVICHMSIIDETQAAQTVLTNGDYEIFDDVGCMVKFMLEQQESSLGANYVKNFETGEWLNIEDATFAYHQDFWTPMNYGVLAFSSNEKAQAYVKSQGKGEILTNEQLKEHEWGVHSNE